MEHSEALDMMATEKYLLDEMIPSEREAFEEHFFVCAECADDVRDGRVLLDSGRAVARENARPARSAPQVWWAMAASLAFVAMIGYQNLVTIPRLHTERDAAMAPHVLHSLSFLTAGSRGVESQIVAAGDQPFTLDFDIPPQQAFASYRCAVRDSGGSTRFNVILSASDAKTTVQLLIPGGVLSGGEYQLVIEGVSSSRRVEIAQYPFSIRSR
ncbi:MAG TPA: hypothetical protein VEZ11_13955 [Thermoanaerobaculia bacterium]|nr:hypothetical protein [Thermoanaerobaculia bacterium]